MTEGFRCGNINLNSVFAKNKDFLSRKIVKNNEN